MLETLKKLFNRAKTFVQIAAYNLYDLPTTIYDYFFTDFGSAELREALRNPVVEFKRSEDATAMRIINPEIDLAVSYRLKYIAYFDVPSAQENNGKPLIFESFTSRMVLSSIDTNPQSITYKTDLLNLIALRKDPRVMAITATAEETTELYKQLSDRMRKGNPYSAMMAYLNTMERTFVGMFTLTEGKIVGELEFAAILNPRVWNKGFLTEAALLLFTIPATLRRLGYTVSSGGQKAVLKTVSSTAYLNNFTEPTLRSLMFTPRERNGDGEEARNLFREDVDSLDEVWQNSRPWFLSDGKIANLSKPSNVAPSPIPKIG